MASRGYTAEFKREAVRQASQSGTSPARVAQDLRIHANVLHRWMRELTPSKNGRVAKGDVSSTSLAQENLRLSNKLQARDRQLIEALEQQTAAGEILRAISSSRTDAQPVFETIIRNGVRLGGADFGSFIPVEDGKFEIGAHCNFDPEMLECFRAAFPHRVSRGTPYGHAVVERTTVNVPDLRVANYSAASKKRAAALGVHALLAVPLMLGEAAVGAITIARRERGAFSDAQVSLLKTFAGQAAIAIANVRLFHELEVKSQQLELANEAKSRFLAAASHDLRQPVNALALFVGQLQEKLRGGAGPSNLTVLAQRIGDSVDTFQQLLDALLDISKLDAGAVVPEREVFALQPLLQQMADEFAPSAAAKGLELRVQPTSLWIESDPLLLGRIVMNLLSNAVRYTESGRIVVGCRRRGTDAEILVADSGIGIVEQELTHIFKEFYQIAPPAHGRTRGLGLGLAIVERLAHLLEHALTLRSKLGRGSVFGVRAPMAAPQLEMAEVSGTVEPTADPTVDFAESRSIIR